MAVPAEPSIDDYLRKRLMPVEGAIPHLAGIDMYGNSIPAGSVGGDLFEYINLQQRTTLMPALLWRYLRARQYLEPFPEGQPIRNSVGRACVMVNGRSKTTVPCWRRNIGVRGVQSVKPTAEHLQAVIHDGGKVLLVDVQGDGAISAEIASIRWTIRFTSPTPGRTDRPWTNHPDAF